MDVRTHVRTMMADGYLALEHVVQPDLVSQARRAVLQRYERFFHEANHENALQVGTRRYMITLRIEPPFDDDEFIANPRLLPIIRGALGNDCVLANYGLVCSLPGAPAQHMHRDGGDLFPETPLDGILPACAITVAIPLLELNELHGTTALCPGSHRTPSGMPEEASEYPVVREGGALLWDYRLAHQGTPNVSERVRPLLYATYCRSWFIDRRNFAKQPPLELDDAAWEKLSPEAQALIWRR